MTKKNRAAILYKAYDLRLEEVPIPEFNDDEVLIQLKASGICGSDVHYYKEGRVGDYIVENPMILGHESAGEIVEVGKNVKNFKPGDRVAIEPGVPCFKCRYCKEGKYNLCPDIFFFATPPDDGSFVDYVKFTSDFLFKLPDNMSYEEGAMLEPFSVGLFAVHKAQQEPGATVLVLGAGTIGLMTIQAAAVAGAGKIIAVDIKQENLELAKKLGATDVINAGKEDVLQKAPELCDDREIDVIYDAVGIGRTVRQGIELIKKGGTVVWIGLSNEEEAFSIGKIVFKEINIKGMFRYANMYQKAINLVEKGLVDLKSMITKRISFEEIPETMKAIADGQVEGVKTIVNM